MANAILSSSSLAKRPFTLRRVLKALNTECDDQIR